MQLQNIQKSPGRRDEQPWHRARKCVISNREKRRLRDLFREIDEAQVEFTEPAEGPHHLRICT